MLRAYYAAMQSELEAVDPSADYLIERDVRSLGIKVARKDRPPFVAEDEGDMLFMVEDDLNVALQYLRPDLYFFHAACIELGGKAVLLAGESGAGKSTTTWGLLHHGFRYLSDELAPIGLGELQVSPYPRALCLKREIAAYPTPCGALAVNRAVHIPVDCMPAASVRDPLPLGLIILLRYCPDLRSPVARRLSPAEAAARLYVTALNALAHPKSGMEGVARITQSVPCFTVESVDLFQSCALIRSLADDMLCSEP
jgi:hypothetical protein